MRLAFALALPLAITVSATSCSPVDSGVRDPDATSTGDPDASPIGDSPGDAIGPASTWSAPRSLVDDIGRLAIGTHVHVVGHLGGNLVHRRSSDDGATWSDATTIAGASGNFPGMYGGLFAQGTTVYLLTAPEDMASSANVSGEQLDFRKSTDDGDTWSSPIRITVPGTSIFRVRLVASGSFVHVAGTSDPTGDASIWYFRSTDGGSTWSSTALDTNLGTYGGGQTVAVDGSVVHVAYTKAVNGVGGGPTLYRRSTDNGATWSAPVIIGESSAESNRQARVQLTAADGRVFAIWQREGLFTGATVPPDRIGYNRSSDQGQTWGVPQILPLDTGVDRNHQHAFMAPGGGVHVIWRHGDSGDTVDDPAGYLYSPDYGATWGAHALAIDTTASIAGSNHPWSVVANERAVHVLTGPGGSMQYAFRLLP